LAHLPYTPPPFREPPEHTSPGDFTRPRIVRRPAVADHLLPLVEPIPLSRPRTDIPPRNSRRTTLTAVLLLAIPGCALLQLSQRTEGLGPDATAEQVREAMLPPIPTSKDAVELEIVFVERPVDDPLLGERLWREIDTGGAIDVQRRKILNQNGLLVGVAPANPPSALQTLLGLQNDLSSSPNNKLAWQRRVLPHGAEAELQTSPVHSQCSVTLLSADGAEQRDYENARFLFRIMARRVQNGWVQVDFLPEIHHGDVAMRHEAAEVGFTMRASQKVKPLMGQRFSINLNLGEMAVLSCDASEAPQSVGRHFFVRDAEGVAVKRLLIVRLAGMSEVEVAQAK
jgi:hypothetical protein